MDIIRINQEIETYSAQEAVSWSLDLGLKTVVSTNFGPFEAVLLHMATLQKPDIEVLWVDSGYNLKKTYQFQKNLSEKLNLNLKVFTPERTALRQDTNFDGVPKVSDPSHKEFTEIFKLQPFKKALKSLETKVWLTAIRKEQTEFRSTQEKVSQTKDGIIKVAPLLEWKEEQMREYIKEHNLPNEESYFDPTKALTNRECGLHLET